MVNKICEDCWRFEAFAEECDFHYIGKRECSKWSTHPNNKDQFITEEELKYGTK